MRGWMYGMCHQLILSGEQSSFQQGRCPNHPQSSGQPSNRCRAPGTARTDTGIQHHRGRTYRANRRRSRSGEGYELELIGQVSLLCYISIVFYIVSSLIISCPMATPMDQNHSNRFLIEDSPRCSSATSVAEALRVSTRYPCPYPWPGLRA